MIDFSNPDYGPVYKRRVEKLAAIRRDPLTLAHLRIHYKHNPWDFIEDWGMTYDPRVLRVKGRATSMPFILFPRQKEWLQWAYELWLAGENGLTEKSRDCGVSWLGMALQCTLGVFYDDFTGGAGSRVSDLVDNLADSKSLFWKARYFLANLPAEFNNGWSEAKHSKIRLISIPGTGSSLVGEIGDNIGRGGRTSMYLLDEAAHLEHPVLVEAALSQNTSCQIDVSSVNGPGNPFHQKRFSFNPKFVFIFDWRDDPRKDQAWYDEQVRKFDPVVVAQEIDRDYLAAVEGAIIPSAWVQAAIDADKKLQRTVTGSRMAAFDVADEGKDNCAYGMREGIRLDRIEEWSGKGSDIHASTARVWRTCHEDGVEGFLYDADGIGADVKGAVRTLLEGGQMPLQVGAFRGSGEVLRPEDKDEASTPNKAMFANRKAQAWWSLRRRFYRTFLAVTKGEVFDTDDLISLSPSLTLLSKLTTELCQPTYSTTTAGKILVNKAPDGTRSPNLADVVMMLYSGSTIKRGLVVSTEVANAVF